MKILIKPFDAAWFFVEKSQAPAHFGPLIVLSPPRHASRTFVGEFVQQWRSCAQFAPPFNYRLSRDRVPSWEVLADEDIDLEYHLRHSALPQPGGERELGMLISRLHSHRLDRRRPLWECHVIEGLEHGRFAIYLKLHHGQLDGMGSVKLLDRVFSKNVQARELLPPWCIGMRSSRKAPEPMADGPKKKSAALRAALSVMPGVATTMATMLRDAYSGRRPDLSVPFQAPNTILNGRIGGQRRYATQRYELSRIKRVAKAGNVKINDVFLTIAGGGLRRYLSEIDALPAKPLIGQIPVNVRPPGDASVGNALAFIYASLGTQIADPIERLKAVHASVEAGKSIHESLPPGGLDPFTMLLVGPYIAQVILDLGGHVRPAANLVISNITGPRERLYFNGARVEQIYGPSVLFHGQALNITMSSYADEVNIGFTGCRDSLPHMQKLAVYTGEALDELEAGLGLKNEPA